MRKLLSLLFLFTLIDATYAQQPDTLWMKEHADTIYYKTDREIKEPKPLQKKIRPEPVELERNLFYFNICDLLLQNFSIGIDFVPGKGKFGITMPLSFYSPLGKAFVNVRSNDLGKYRESLATFFRAGFEFNYYPYGQKKYTYLTGLGLQGAYLKRDVDVQVDEGKGIYQGLYFYFLGKTGVNITYWQQFSVSFMVHAGVKTPDLQNYYFALLGHVGVGVRF